MLNDELANVLLRVGGLFADNFLDFLRERFLAESLAERQPQCFLFGIQLCRQLLRHQELVLLPFFDDLSFVVLFHIIENKDTGLALLLLPLGGEQLKRDVLFF